MMPDQDCHNCKHKEARGEKIPCDGCVSVHTMTHWEAVLC